MRRRHWTTMTPAAEMKMGSLLIFFLNISRFRINNLGIGAQKLIKIGKYFEAWCDKSALTKKTGIIQKLDISLLLAYRIFSSLMPEYFKFFLTISRVEL